MEQPGKVYRGLLSTMTIAEFEENMPELLEGDFGYALDTKTLFIGNKELGNVNVGGSGVVGDIDQIMNSVNQHETAIQEYADAIAVIKTHANSLNSNIFVDAGVLYVKGSNGSYYSLVVAEDGSITATVSADVQPPANL